MFWNASKEKMMDAMIFFFAAFEILLLLRWGIVWRGKTVKVQRLQNELLALTIVVPLKGWDNSLPALVTALLCQQYAKKVEIFIIVDSSNPYLVFLPQDEKVTLVYSKPKPEGWMDKNWRLYQGAQLANYPAVLFLDSDVTVDQGFLERRQSQHIGHFSFCLPYYIRPTNMAERFLAAYTNYTNTTIYRSSFALARPITAIGPSMLFTIDKRKLLEGLSAIAGEIADDHAIAHWCWKQGYQIKCLEEPIYVVKCGETWGGVLKQIVRWTMLPKAVRHLVTAKTLAIMGANVMLNLSIPVFCIWECYFLRSC